MPKKQEKWITLKHIECLTSKKSNLNKDNPGRNNKIKVIKTITNSQPREQDRIAAKNPLLTLTSCGQDKRHQQEPIETVIKIW